jgi:hypothetical protein
MRGGGIADGESRKESFGVTTLRITKEKNTKLK